MNWTVRLVSDRARGFRRLDPLLALLTRICGRVRVSYPPEPPTSDQSPLRREYARSCKCAYMLLS